MQRPAQSPIISTAVIIILSGFILFDTGRRIDGTESSHNNLDLSAVTNYQDALKRNEFANKMNTKSVSCLISTWPNHALLNWDINND